MPVRIPVTQDGLAACPSCHHHVRVDRTEGDVVCPFCDHAWGVSARVSAPGTAARIGAAVGGAILVAVQLGACSSDVYGAPPDDDVGYDTTDTTADVETEGSGEPEGSGETEGSGDNVPTEE